MGTHIMTVVEVFDPSTKEWRPEFGRLVQNPLRPPEGEDDDDYNEWIRPWEREAMILRCNGAAPQEPDTLKSQAQRFELLKNGFFRALFDYDPVEGDDFPVLSTKKGLPRNRSSATQTLFDNGRGSYKEPGYVTLAELELVLRLHLERLAQNPITHFYDAEDVWYLHQVVAHMHGLLAQTKHIRMVFWFW